MNSTRKIAVITGVIFIIATVLPILASSLVPVLTGADYLTQFSAHTNQVAAGVLLILIGYFACAGIAVVMYPVLKKWNAGLALGSVVFRTIETAFYMVGLVCLLSLLTLGQQFTTAGAADRTSLQAIGNLLVSVRDNAALVAVFAFCLGAFMYYYLFFQSRLIPRWLSGFGIVAIILMMAACVLALFSGNRITSYIPLAAPIAVQEMVLAVWLIVKGFNPSVIASHVCENRDERAFERGIDLHYRGEGGLKTSLLPAQLHVNARGIDLKKRTQHITRRKQNAKKRFDCSFNMVRHQLYARLDHIVLCHRAQERLPNFAGGFFFRS